MMRCPSGPIRIEMHVATQFPRVRIVLDQHRLEAALIERVFPVAALVEQRSLAAVEVSHPDGQIRLGRSQVEVEVIVERRNGEDSPATTAGDTLEQPPPMTAVVVIDHDVATLQPALSDVMQSVRNVDALGTRHGDCPLSILGSRFWGRAFKFQNWPSRRFAIHTRLPGQF